MSTDIDLSIAWALARLRNSTMARIEHAFAATAGLREHHTRAMAQKWRKVERDIFGAMGANQRR